MGSHITLRKLRKTVHKIMLKYGKKKFFKKIDWINKVLKKLKIKPTLKRKARIRNQINRWLCENSDYNNDSKKGILDAKPSADPSNRKDESTEKENKSNKSNSNQENQTQSQLKDQVDRSKSNISNIIIPPMPKAISIKNLKEELAVIDLVSDDENEVEKSIEVEVITIDDNDEPALDNAQINLSQCSVEEMLPWQPLMMLPEEYYNALRDNYYRYD